MIGIKALTVARKAMMDGRNLTMETKMEIAPSLSLSLMRSWTLQDGDKEADDDALLDLMANQ